MTALEGPHAPISPLARTEPRPPLRFADVLSDHCVLQRGVTVPVWGTGPEGQAVEVRFAGQVRHTVVRDGLWSIGLDPMPAGGPFELSLRVVEAEAAPAGDPGTDPLRSQEPVFLTDILVGEVFLAGGQSNMAFTLKYSKGYEFEAADAFLPLVRYYEVPRLPYEGAAWYEQREEFHYDAWEVCIPESAGRMSAVAFHFARRLHESLGVPVGIVGCSWGGTSASCWMPESALADDPDLRVYLDDYAAAVAVQGPGGAERNFDAYKEATRLFKEGKGPESPWEPPIGPRSFLRPCGLYHSMFRKVSDYAFAGAIWYQGESDDVRGVLYRRLFARMIRQWREDLRNPALPFLFVQLPSYWSEDDDGDLWPVLRESQRRVTEEVPGTAMVVVLDAGDARDIHPTHKKPVGGRLALAALRLVYGRDVEASGPVLESWTREGERLRLRFSHAEYGLVLRGNALTGFTLKTPDEAVVPIEAEIRGREVFVAIAGSVATGELRYGWTNTFEPTLYNANGLPASPFRITL